MTNAHVVAGQDDTTIQTNDGQSASATPIAFNTRNDIAILYADASTSRRCRLARVRRGTAGGDRYPNDGPLTITRPGPARPAS